MAARRPVERPQFTSSLAEGSEAFLPAVPSTRTGEHEWIRSQQGTEKQMWTRHGTTATSKLLQAQGGPLVSTEKERRKEIIYPIYIYIHIGSYRNSSAIEIILPRGRNGGSSSVLSVSRSRPGSTTPPRVRFGFRHPSTQPRAAAPKYTPQRMPRYPLPVPHFPGQGLCTSWVRAF